MSIKGTIRKAIKNIRNLFKRKAPRNANQPPTQPLQPAPRPTITHPAPIPAINHAHPLASNPVTSLDLLFFREPNEFPSEQEIPGF
ncbi:hypothetical protein EG328_004255 [Venturia inaequalis]|uniref:Uncharacterized protein n=1 Tax=Venturia inaequalis TaxID=5025 RepID=A0A8H3UMQ9_VENIN|nr:hypothetical protein EG328_004255 [Venturia inaequalis]RDI87701.1 hypothetical protein Vi05172_g2211 [Venturia inaequalis]